MSHHMYIIVCFFAFLHGALKIQCMTHAAHRVLWKDSNVGSALVGKASCGDVIKLQVRRRGRVGWLYHIYICIVKICLIYGMIYGMIYRLDRMDMYVQYGYIIYGYYTWILYLDI